MVITGSFSLVAVIDGHDGAKLRIRDWVEGEYYLAGKNGEEFYDVVLFSNNRLYLCTQTIKNVSQLGVNDPVTSEKNRLGIWVMAKDWDFVATKLLLADKIVSGKITADVIDADGIVAKNAKIEGDITTKTLTMIESTQSTSETPTLVDGSIILETGNYLLPTLKEGETRQIMYHKSQITRIIVPPLNLFTNGVDKICIDGNALTAQKNIELPGVGTYLILGHRDSVTAGHRDTLWSVYQINKEILDIPPRDTFDVVSETAEFYTLPKASSHPGKIFVKLLGITTVRSYSPIYRPDNNITFDQEKDGYYRDTFSRRALIFANDGTNWYCFACYKY